MVERLFLAVLWGCLLFVIVVFPGHTHLLFLCVFSQMKDIKHIRRYFHWVPWVMPKGLGLGGTGVSKFNFLNMVIWHIKLKGMNSSPGYTENFDLHSNW